MTFTVVVDHEQGGRWLSLRDPSGREWCWDRPDERRLRARAGDVFVDVGGVEECFPTLAGDPDHGDPDHGEVWTSSWTRDDVGGYVVHAPDWRLHREIEVGSDVQVRYRLVAAPGFRFVWAFHLLVVPALDLAVGLPAGCALRTWPQGYGGEPVETRWPYGPGPIRFDQAGADDGTAGFALAPGISEVTLTSAGRRLRMELSAGTHPVAIGLWRNLRGWAWDDSDPYRSFGVEPMIGHHPSRQRAATKDAGVVGPAGTVSWSLRISEARC